METQTLNDALGDKSDSLQQPKTIDTGRRYVSTQEYLCGFSVFMRVLIVIMWVSMVLSFIPQGYLAYEIAGTTLIDGVIAAILWFTLGNIHSTKLVVWEERVKEEGKE